MGKPLKQPKKSHNKKPINTVDINRVLRKFDGLQV